MALAGLILGIVGTIGAIIWIVALSGAFIQGFEQGINQDFDQEQFEQQLQDELGQ